MKLYGYFRSTAAYRVRIVLNLKNLDTEHAFVHLRHGEQHEEAFRQINPEGLVPTLYHDGNAIPQSLSIIDYLDELYPNPPLLPASAADRAYVRALGLAIVCDIHPLNNLRVLNYMRGTMGMTAAQISQWYAHWIEIGLRALETRIARDQRTGTFCFGDTPGLADACLVPQIYNAERMKCDLTPYPALRRITAAARALPQFAAAAPERQPDFEP